MMLGLQSKGPYLGAERVKNVLSISFLKTFIALMLMFGSNYSRNVVLLVSALSNHHVYFFQIYLVGNSFFFPANALLPDGPNLVVIDRVKLDWILSDLTKYICCNIG